MIKPKLLNKQFINNFISKNIINKKDSKIMSSSSYISESNNNFFTFLFIILLIFGILFLIYRYLEKKNNKDI